MQRWSALPRPFLASLAGILAIAATLYGIVWMYAVRNPGPIVELGFNQKHDSRFEPITHSILVLDVSEGSPAERAGLRAGDRISGVNGKELSSDLGYDESYLQGHPGDSVVLTVQRPGEEKPLILQGIFRAKRKRGLDGANEGIAKSSALQVIGLFPIPFLLVGFVVLFLRLEEPTAWLLALLFCGFICAPDLALTPGISPALKTFMLAFRALFLGMIGPLSYLFFAEFPVRSPLDRKFPWLKWAGLAFGAFIALPGLLKGSPSFPQFAAKTIGAGKADLAISLFVYAYFLMGILNLAQNSFAKAVPDGARRKSRVILLGTVAGVLPIVLERVAVDFAKYHPSFWFDTALVLVFSLYPLSFAYAVVKHRVMEIPALLRRSARYVLVQRGYIVLLFAAAVATIALFTRTFSRFFEAGSNAAMMLSAGFGIAIVWVSAPLVKRGTQRIDHAFFRSAYDARVILEDLVEKTRTVSERHELAALIEKQVRGALHPKSLACYLDAGDGNLVAESGKEPSSAALPRPKFPFRFGARFVLREADSIPVTMPMLGELARSGKSWDVPPYIVTDREELATPDPLAAECLVPILGRTGGLIGLIALGQRQSEEPYSGEDKHLLDSVAAQAGITLENIMLAKKMAERMEVDRRVAREMEIAREVQARLFPQKFPVMKTLEYLGGCLPAREVGGDYYDFLQLQGGHLALVLADIAGKGVSGALLMANLQANLRSQCAMDAEDLRRVLTSVNRSFCENTGDASYATLFFADYDDSSRKLRYANCGHLPPLLLSAGGGGDNGAAGGGKVVRLHPTSTVVGLFDNWKCEVAELDLAPGDTLVLYTDGVTEARNTAGEEFGEARLVEMLQRSCHLPVESLLQAVVRTVQQFTGGEQQDDITLVVARSCA
jgi:sigma-B regulation protein RsbU (phosphoserine phosphatase)